MLPSFDLQIDTRDIEAGMRDIPNEIPFAVSLGLTWTAQDCAAALRFTMKDHFTLRTDELPKRIGTQMTRRGDQAVLVGSKSWYMALQAEGGERTGKDGGMSWVPVAARRNPQTITRPSKWPGRIDDSGSGGGGAGGDVFTGFVETAVGRRLGTFRRVIRSAEVADQGKSGGRIIRKGGWRGEEVKTGLQLMYWAEKTVEIKARWPLEQIVSEVVAESWEHQAMRALDWTLKNPNAKSGRAPIYR